MGRQRSWPLRLLGGGLRDRGEAPEGVLCASDAPRENEKHEPRSCVPSSVRVMGLQGARVSTPLPELCLQSSPQSIGAWLEHLSPLSFCGEGLSQGRHPVRCAGAFPALRPPPSVARAVC